ncbi:hypothetical protein ACFQZ4_41500 [Catellatospora coxensis]
MSDRVRVDLAAHRRVRPRPGAHDELVEQTPMGDALVRELMRVQLGLALRLAAVVAVALGGLPLLFSLWPAGTHVAVAGMPLPWLLLGVVSFPFLAGAAWSTPGSPNATRPTSPRSSAAPPNASPAPSCRRSDIERSRRADRPPLL